jgi:DNA-binding MarR family transcriptional regulator
MSGKASRYKDFLNSQNELHALFTRALDGMLSAEGVTVLQALTMKSLKEQGGPCRMSDLAARQLHTPAAMTGIVDRLIHLGLVERRSDENDRRVILLALTARGAAISESIENRMQSMMQRFFESMPEKDRETTIRMFLRLTEFLKEETNAKNKA